MEVLKRNGIKKELFDSTKIYRAINEANKATVKEKRITPEQIQELVSWVEKKLPKKDLVEVEEIQDLVEDAFVHKNHTELFRNFRDYRKQAEKNRFLKNETVQMMEAKYSGKAWDKQNANIDGLSFDGKAGEAHGVYDKEYALNYMISPKFAKLHRDMIIYIHDLDNYKKAKHNCLTFPEDDYRDNGMTIKLPKDIRKVGSVGTESQLIMVRLQSQSMPQFGGVSLSHLDSTLAPLVKKDYFELYKKYYERHTGNDLDYSFNKSLSIEEPDYKACNEKVAQWALEDVAEQVHQAMEGLLHNANTLQSRSGNQLPFTSMNYGADTTPEGRLITRELLNAWEEGIGELHLTPIFPCGIFQYGKGINDKPGTPNYDLKKKAIEVLVKRDYPNFANLNWSVEKAAFEKSQSVKKAVLDSLKNDPELRKKVIELPREIQNTLGFYYDELDNVFVMNKNPQPFEMMSTMGCRTYNGFDKNFTEEYFKKVLERTVKDKKLPRNMLWSGNQKDGRGNIAPATIILPMVAMKAKKKNPEDVVETFIKLLDGYIADARDELIERFKWIAAQDAESSTYMYGNATMKGYEPEEGIISALKHGTFAIGQIGLAECLEILIGCDHTTCKGMDLAKRIEQLFKDRCTEFKDELRDINGTKCYMNFGVYYTPAENLCFTSFKAFKKKYGKVENVTYFIDENGREVEKNFFTNSIHVPVYKKISPFDKIDIESQLTGYSSAGCITYVEIDDEVKHNLKAIEQIIDYAMEHDIPYFALNFQINECCNCGNTDNLSEDVGVCPICGSVDINWLRRITGYLNGNYKKSFNDGKQREVQLRAQHTKFTNIKMK